MISGTMATVIQKTVNADIPYVPWLTGYLAILVGAAATFLLQSSSVFTSALTPLVGMGIITVSRTYPLTLGSNIGTTTTAMLAALTASADKLKDSIQVSLCHLFFNLTAIVIFYPIPFMRWPIPLAKGLGRITAQYRWFAFAYLLGAFLIIPLFVLGLSLADPSGIALLCVLIPVGIIIIFVVIVNLLQQKYPKILPSKLKTWDWLPLCLRSLAPTDKLMMKAIGLCSCCKKALKDDDGGVDNSGFEQLEIH
jgi:sodium-dependent phosphate cotransporter